MKPKCSTKHCRKKATKNGGGRCSKCKMREWRKANPVKAMRAHLRWRAIKYKMPFDLDLAWLEKFLKENSYDRLYHHIDRISVLGGYTKNNVQVLTSGENIAKGNRERHGQCEAF